MHTLFPGYLRRWCDPRAAAALVLAALPLCSGCALWKSDLWNLDRYRDEQAVDVEHHLNREKPIVANPF